MIDEMVGVTNEVVEGWSFWPQEQDISSPTFPNLSSINTSFLSQVRGMSKQGSPASPAPPFPKRRVVVTVAVLVVA